MNKGQRSAILLSLLKSLAAHGSWCGETHVQKAVFLLQEATGSDTGFEFILYKHGPFSFELRDALAELSAEGLIDYVVRDPNYGPSITVTNESQQFLERFPKTQERHAARIDFVAGWLGDRGVSDLERLGTAVFVMNRFESSDASERAAQLVELKPHVAVVDAKEAVKEAEGLLRAGRHLQCS